LGEAYKSTALAQIKPAIGDGRIETTFGQELTPACLKVGAHFFLVGALTASPRIRASSARSAKNTNAGDDCHVKPEMCQYLNFHSDFNEIGPQCFPENTAGKQMGSSASQHAVSKFGIPATQPSLEA